MRPMTPEQFVTHNNITATSEGAEAREGWHAGASHYLVTLTCGAFDIEVPFSMGSAHTEEPTALDVLAAPLVDAQCGEYDFDEFCDNLGYDTDSRKAFAAWEACQGTADDLILLMPEGTTLDYLYDLFSDY